MCDPSRGGEGLVLNMIFESVFNGTLLNIVLIKIFFTLFTNVTFLMPSQIVDYFISQPHFPRAQLGWCIPPSFHSFRWCWEPSLGFCVS